MRIPHDLCGQFSLREAIKVYSSQIRLRTQNYKLGLIFKTYIFVMLWMLTTQSVTLHPLELVRKVLPGPTSIAASQ